MPAQVEKESLGEYIAAVRNVKSRRSLGQNFLICQKVADAEAAHALGKNVLEIGPGLGFLTRELCRVAKKVTAVEKDALLSGMLRARLQSGNLEVIEGDFLDVSASLPKDIDILIANIPYNISSKVIEWAVSNGIESVICLQKEFVEHMTAKPGTRDYRRLSVACALTVSITEIMDVPPTCFLPRPKVISELIYMRPNGFVIREADYGMIRLLMEHKKKRVKNALSDSRKQLGLDASAVKELSLAPALSESVVFKLTPQQILETAREASDALKRIRKGTST